MKIFIEIFFTILFFFIVFMVLLWKFGQSYRIDNWERQYKRWRKVKKLSSQTGKELPYKKKITHEEWVDSVLKKILEPENKTIDSLKK